jgi:hypothetical protein
MTCTHWLYITEQGELNGLIHSLRHPTGSGVHPRNSQQQPTTGALQCCIENAHHIYCRHADACISTFYMLQLFD